jgi:uncharacterized protein (DUF427 family)
MVRAIWNGAVLAESARTIRLEGNHYFPPQTVNFGYLQPSTSRSHCAWKGEAHYYDVVANGHRNPNAAWFYPAPSPAATEIKDHVAFWKGVNVR